MEQNNTRFRQWRRGIAPLITAAILASMFLPITGSASTVSKSTALASPEDNPGQGQQKEHCPPGVNHVPEDSNAYEVLVSLCEGEKPPGNPHG